MRSSIRSSNSGAIALGVARTGSTFAAYAGIHLNSPYDPVREAARFLNRTTISMSPTLCLVLGDTLPYLREALRARYPAARIASVYYHDDFPEIVRTHFPGSPPDSEWSPSSPRDLRNYLLDLFEESEPDGIAVFQWPPAATAFPETAATVSATVQQVFREAAGGWLTSAGFARAWLHNLFVNFLTIDAWHLLDSHAAPVVVAASGPSLADAIPLLARCREHLSLVALPSSLKALTEAGLVPDLLVTVDAGYWAQLHLRSLSTELPTPVVLPLTASRGIWRRPVKPVVVSSGSYIETALFQIAGMSPFEILATGTVAASALELAREWTTGPIVAAGLDLCYDGLREHVSPHTFDAFHQSQVTRTAPLLTTLTGRSVRFEVGRPAGRPTVTRAMSTYAGWLRRWTAEGRSYRLFPSSVDLEGLQPLDERSFTELISASPHRTRNSGPKPSSVPSRSDRHRLVRELLSSWDVRLAAAYRQVRNVDSIDHRAAVSGVSSLLESLVPRDYLRYRRTRRSEPTAPPPQVAELLASAIEEVDLLKRRFAS